MFADFFLFLSKRSIIQFCRWGRWGSHNWSFFVDATNVWPLNGLKLQPIQLLEADVSSSTSSQIHSDSHSEHTTNKFIGKWSKFQKEVGKSKRGRIKYQGGSLFFYQSKLLSHFVLLSLSRYYTKREIFRIKLTTVLLLWSYDLDARRILKYLNIDLSTKHVF